MPCNLQQKQLMSETKREYIRIVFLIFSGLLSAIFLIAMVVNYVNESKRYKNSLITLARVQQNQKEEYATSNSFRSIYIYEIDSNHYQGITASGERFQYNIGDTIEIIVDKFDHSYSRVNRNLEIYGYTYSFLFFFSIFLIMFLISLLAKKLFMKIISLPSSSDGAFP